MEKEQRRESSGIGSAAAETGSRMAAQYMKEATSQTAKAAASSVAGTTAGATAGATAGSTVAPGPGTIVGYIAGLAASAVKDLDKFFVGFLGILLVFVLLFNGVFGANLVASSYDGYMKYSAMSYSNTSTLNQQVLSYMPDVTAEAKKYGTEDYVKLFLAVMMQESSGQAIDVYQCAESLGYGPQGTTGNAITTQQSIAHGVLLLSNYIKVAGVESPTDIVHIKLALQAYNMSGGFIEFANKNYGGYTLEAAFSYQKKQSKGVKRTSNVETLGPYAYGDAYYADHVLRYYTPDFLTNSNSPIPIYYQTDYAHVPYGDGSIAECGCGPTAFAMVASYLTGRVITPLNAVEWCGNAYYTSVGTSWSYFKAATTHFGLPVTVRTTTDKTAVIEALKQGKAVISSQRPGLFTSTGHFIVLSGIDENGRIYVNDPNKANAVNKGYNNRTFNFDTEINITSKQYWIWG